MNKKFWTGAAWLGTIVIGGYIGRIVPVDWQYSVGLATGLVTQTIAIMHILDHGDD